MNESLFSPVDYCHTQNAHSLEGPRAALPQLLRGQVPRSLLDVGCGRGTWLKAAFGLGIQDIFGVDGVNIPESELLISKSNFEQVNLEQEWGLGRRFEMALCFEVAEHLSPNGASMLVRCLARHADTIMFSAACPAQEGQHHINLQWPAYWQELFNREGYRCEDSLRWLIWLDDRIEPWYRQNLFLARRALKDAGTEPRLLPVLHPSVLTNHSMLGMTEIRRNIIGQVSEGSEPAGWYLTQPMQALSAKIFRYLGRK